MYTMHQALISTPVVTYVYFGIRNTEFFTWLAAVQPFIDKRLKWELQQIATTQIKGSYDYTSFF